MRYSNVIVCPKAGQYENKIIVYRKLFNANKNGEFVVNVFADARYKLYVNGILADVGPAKGNNKELYYNTVDLGRLLKDGENEIKAYVLNLSSLGDVKTPWIIMSLTRNGTGAFELWGTLNGSEFKTDDSWECAVDDSVEFSRGVYAFLAGACESVNAKKSGRLKWDKAAIAENGKYYAWGESRIWNNTKSPIPLMRLDKMKINLCIDSVFDFGYLTTSYLKIKCSGTGKLKLTYAERYKAEGSEDRADKDGIVEGDFDILDIDGDFVYEPYWYRCFRFIKVETEGDVKINDSYAYETGYPIEIKANYNFGNKADNKLWEISLRTLERCMQDTFMDCPYYEQLQYGMDTYLQSIFAYQLSGDDRLQRRAIRDFALSVNADGLVQSRTPGASKQFIPAFALFYIMMVLEHFKRFRDKKLFCCNMPTILQVLNWFAEHSNCDGMVVKSEYWHFIDWAQDFKGGVPPYEEGATLGIENLMLCRVLSELAEAVKGTEYCGFAAEFSKRADNIRNYANEMYYSEEEGAYALTEKKTSFCQHMQVWAVLSGTAEGDRAKNIMQKSFEFKNAQSSFSFSYFLFRALEKTGLYHLRENTLDKLRRLTEYNCTTVPETPEMPRSECHAWSAVALYEFTAMDLGVREIDGKIVIKPYTDGRNSAKGTVMTSFGGVYVEWEKKNGRIKLKYKAPDGIDVVL